VTRLGPLLAACLLAATSVHAAGAALAATSDLPAKTRKVVMEKKSEGGYRWKLIEAKVPPLGERQVLMRVRAVALNRGDIDTLEPGRKRDYSGLVPTSDGAGDIVAVGAKVGDFRPGMRVTNTYFRNWVDGPFSQKILSEVIGDDIDGMMAEYVVLDDTSVAPMAESLTYEQAATLPTAGVTAWMGSLGNMALPPGSVVLVQGTGGVSVLAAQLTAAAGARVIVTSSSDEKLARIGSFGAKDGINYRKVPDWSAEVMRLTQGHGADLIVELGGKDTLAESTKSLAYGGTLSIVGGLTGYDGTLNALALLMKTARTQGVYVGSREDFRRLNIFIDAYGVKPHIDRVFAFEQFEDALKHMASGNFIGKVVITLPAQRRG
jgi:NADPH:quinone reductase-like Zn-dependent oxidoreductase